MSERSGSVSPNVAYALLCSLPLSVGGPIFLAILAGLPTPAVVVGAAVGAATEWFLTAHKEVAWDMNGITATTAFRRQRIEFADIDAVGLSGSWALRWVAIRTKDARGSGVPLHGTDWTELTPRQQGELVRSLRAAVAACCEGQGR
jgi:hypothetical protein